MSRENVTVLWDMDGTLIDSEPLHQASLKHVLKTQGIPWNVEIEHALLGRDEQEVHAWCVGRFGLQLTFSAWTSQRKSYFHLHIKSLRPRVECWAIFTQLRRLGAVQAFVSNASSEILNANARALNLLPEDWIMVSRDDVKHGKPNPEPYIRAAQLLNVGVRQCVVVEDSLPGAMAGIAANASVLYWPQNPNAPSAKNLRPCRSPTEARAFFSRHGYEGINN